MPEIVLHALLGLAVASTVASAAYIAIAIRCIATFGAGGRPSATVRPPVSILKPIFGLDVELHENLRSFFVQDYPVYQIVFGVQDASDPAIGVIERVRAEFPGVDASLTVAKAQGANLKVANLANTYTSAKHPFIVIADSDMRVDRTYLASVIAPFADPAVGAVTCLYKGTPAGGLASFLASMFINGWFLPSVLVRANLGDIGFCLGATMAVRREAFDEIGGFGALAPFLADDYMLGQLIVGRGYKVALSDYVVENVVHERGFAGLFRHELRWARTVRTVAAWGHAFSFLMYPVPLALVSAVLIQAALGWTAGAWGVVALAIALRAWLQAAVHAKLGLPSDGRALWLVPVRDILSFAVWVASFFGRGVTWKDRGFAVAADGRMTPGEP